MRKWVLSNATIDAQLEEVFRRMQEERTRDNMFWKHDGLVSTMSDINLSKYAAAVSTARTIRLHGKVTQVVGLVIEGYCPDTSVGAICEIRTRMASLFRGSCRVP
jgi:hypothetical protein